MALFPRLPRWAGTRKIKPIWILLKQETEWQWHQLGHVQICSSFQIDNHASTSPLSFLKARCPSCCPTNSIKALKAKALKASSTTSCWKWNSDHVSVSEPRWLKLNNLDVNNLSELIVWEAERVDNQNCCVLCCDLCTIRYDTIRDAILTCARKLT